MSLLYFFILLIINLVYLFRNRLLGLLVYLGICLTAPIIVIGSYRLSYEILSFPIICWACITYFTINKKNIWLVLYFIYLVIVSIIFAAINSSGLNYIGFYACFRFVIITSLLISLVDKFPNKVVNPERLLLVIIGINLLACVFQLFQPACASLFYNLYWKPGNAPLEYALEHGFVRGYGTFGSPIVLGVFSLFTFSYFLSVKKNFYGIFLSIILGLLALSKTFILGSIIIVLLYLFFYCRKANSIMRIRKRTIFSFFRVSLFVLFIVLILYVLVLYMDKQGIPILYYINLIGDPLAAFVTRYDASDGNMIPLIEAFQTNPVFGYGDSDLPGVFVGDTSFFVILYSTGLIGFTLMILFFFPFVYHSLINLKWKNYAFLVVVAYFISYIGTNIYIMPISSFIIYTMYLSNKRFCNSVS